MYTWARAKPFFVCSSYPTQCVHYTNIVHPMIMTEGIIWTIAHLAICSAAIYILLHFQWCICCCFFCTQVTFFITHMPFEIDSNVSLEKLPRPEHSYMEQKCLFYLMFQDNLSMPKASQIIQCKTATSVWSSHNLQSSKHAEDCKSLRITHHMLNSWTWAGVWHITEVFLNRIIIMGCYALACTLSVNLRCIPTRKRQ